MNLLQGTFALLMTISMLLAAVAVMPVSTEAADPPVWEPRFAHWNMKSDDGLHLQTATKDTAETSKTIQADYDQLPLSRANRREVDAGTWELKEELPGIIHMTGQVKFNLWFRDRDDTYSNDPEFRFILKYQDNDVAEGQASVSGTHMQPYEVTATANLDQDITLAPGETLALNIKYTGWEDTDFLYDNFTYDSGLRVSQDSLWVKSSDSDYKDGKVSVKYTDKAAVDWLDSGYCIRLIIDDVEVVDDADTLKTGKMIDEGNGTKLEEWEASWEDLEFNNTAKIEIVLSFSDFDRPAMAEQTWIANPAEDNGGGGGGGGDDDDDDDFEIAGQDGYLVSGGIGGSAAVAGLVIFLVIRKKKRGADEDDEDYDEEEEEEYGNDEEYEDDEDDE